MLFGDMFFRLGGSVSKLLLSFETSSPAHVFERNVANTTFPKSPFFDMNILHFKLHFYLMNQLHPSIGRVSLSLFKFGWLAYSTDSVKPALLI